MALEHDIREMQRQAFSEGMARNFISQWRALYAFINIYRIMVWLFTNHLMCLFAQFLSYNLKVPSSILNYLSAAKTLHMITNSRPAPNLADYEIKLTMRGLRRCLKHAVTQATPMTPLMLAQIHATLNLKKRIDAVFWATLLLGFFMMVQASNLVPESKKKRSPIRQLSKSSVTFNKTGMVFKIRWSKMIQYQQKILEIPVFKIRNSI